MPIRKITRDGRVGYRWGSHGKIYWGAGGRAKALLQAQAAHAAGYRGSDGK